MKRMSIGQIIIGEKFMEENSKQLLESQLRECYGRVVWSHKTHEKSADIILKRNNILKWSQIILSTLTTSGLIITIFGDLSWVKITSTIISAVLLLLNTYLKSTDLGTIVQKHKEIAVDIWNIRESYLSLITDLKIENVSIENIQIRRDQLQKELALIYKKSPRTINKAYKEATKALKLNEEMTFTDEEIDYLLPIEFRKTKNN